MTALLISAFSSARAGARSTGCPMRATFRMDMATNYTVPQMLHPKDDSHTYQFCPRCGGPLERRVVKASEPERPVCTRCAFVFYLDPKIAVGTIIRSESGRIVLVRRAIEPGYGKDRKSTRLNSSHITISYAVFCLKKKK